jgi:hypothetical protein
MINNIFSNTFIKNLARCKSVHYQLAINVMHYAKIENIFILISQRLTFEEKGVLSLG